LTGEGGKRCAIHLSIRFKGGGRRLKKRKIGEKEKRLRGEDVKKRLKEKRKERINWKKQPSLASDYGRRSVVKLWEEGGKTRGSSRPEVYLQGDPPQAAVYQGEKKLN